MGYMYDGNRELSKQYEKMGDSWWRQYYIIKRFNSIEERETELDAPYIDETKASAGSGEKTWETERKAMKRANDEQLNYMRTIKEVGDELGRLAEEQGAGEIIAELYDFVGLPKENRRRYSEVANQLETVTDIVRETRQTFCHLFAKKMFAKFKK